MRSNNFYAMVKAPVLGAALALCLGACSSHTTELRPEDTSTGAVAVAGGAISEPHIAREVPGVTQFVWEEPMIDVVEVPPGLDPEGHYYRPSHQEIVEIRQGRWKYYRQNQ